MHYGYVLYGGTNEYLPYLVVGYNGKDVLCLPRFLVSMKYMTNHLDSDMNLSNKLQWFRLQKYAIRGFNSALPTSFKFHGLNGFGTTRL